MQNRQVFLSFWGIFCPFTPLAKIEKNWNQNLKKLRKHIWRYHFTHVHHKWQSYDVWFLRYGVQQTKFFVILDHFFFPFYPLTTWKIKILKKWKKTLEISPFYTNVPKILIIDYTVPEIQCMADVIFIFHFGLFFALLPP